MKKRGIPVLIPVLILISMVFIGILIFTYIETKKANPQMIRVSSVSRPDERALGRAEKERNIRYVTPQSEPRPLEAEKNYSGLQQEPPIRAATVRERLRSLMILNRSLTVAAPIGVGHHSAQLHSS